MNAKQKIAACSVALFTAVAANAQETTPKGIGYKNSNTLITNLEVATRIVDCDLGTATYSRNSGSTQGGIGLSTVVPTPNLVAKLCKAAGLTPAVGN